MNRTLVESAKAMISHAGLPNSYWAEAVANAAFVHNRVLSGTLKNEETPYKRWYGVRPNLSMMKVFGCIAYAHIPKEKRQKFEEKSRKA